MELVMRDNRLTVIGAVVVIALCAAWLTYYYLTPDGPPRGNTWWYDLDRSELYTISDRILPPTTEQVPSGGDGVLAVVYTKNDCANPDDLVVVYLFKYTAEGRQIMVETDNVGVARETSDKMMLVKTLKETEWVLRDNVERADLIKDAIEEHDGKLTQCIRP
jgi:hypothetical protein